MPTAPTVASGRPPTWIGLLILYVVWGSTYLGIAIAIDTIPPFLMAATRFLIAGSVLVAWSVAREGRSIALPSAREWRDSAIVGALLLGGGMGMVSFGEQTVPSGITALLVALMPVWVAILGRVFLGERLPRLAVFGVVAGFGGVAILIGPSAFGGSGSLNGLGLAALIVSPISWASGSLFASHRAHLPRLPLLATGIQMLAGGLVLSAMSAASGELLSFRLDAVSPASLGALAYLTVVGSLVAFTAYGWLLRVAPLPLIATYAYVNPVVAVMLGALVRSEPVDPRTVVAGAVIVAAVALIVTARGRMRSPAVPAVVEPATPNASPVVPAATR
ncbi:MAG: EamA family transporter [Candidatus Limnocylindrales bacterium]